MKHNESKMRYEIADLLKQNLHQWQDRAMTLEEHAERLAESLAIIRAEMEALKRDEPNPDKRMRRLGASFSWELVVYAPLREWEATKQ